MSIPNRRKKVLSIALAAVGIGLAASANATLLLPGSGPLAVDILAAVPGGTVLASQSNPVTTPHWSGTARAAVVRTGGVGSTLDFYYQVTNATSSTDALGRVTGADFANVFSTNVFQTAQTATPFSIFLAGNQAASSGDRGSGGVVGFNFAPGASGTGKIDPGETSDILIIRTNAKAFDTGVMGILDGTGTFAPAYQAAGTPLVGPIPEPGTLAQLGSGLIALGGIGRKRMK